MAETRTAEEIRRSIEANRTELGLAVEPLLHEQDVLVLQPVVLVEEDQIACRGRLEIPRVVVRHHERRAGDPLRHGPVQRRTAADIPRDAEAARVLERGDDLGALRSGADGGVPAPITGNDAMPPMPTSSTGRPTMSAIRSGSGMPPRRM